jgi:hypothetical protein
MASSEAIVDTAGEEGLRARSGQQHLPPNYFGAPGDTDNNLKANDRAVGSFINPSHKDDTEALDLDYEIVDHPTTSKTEESKSEIVPETPLETKAITESNQSHFKEEFHDLNLLAQVIILLITAFVQLFKNSKHPLPMFVLLYIFVLVPMLDHMGLY